MVTNRTLRIFILFTVSFAVMFIMSSCERVSLRRDIKMMTKHKIELPSSLVKVYNEEISPVDLSTLQEDIAKLIVYIDSNECGTCRVQRLGIYKELYDLSTQTGLFELWIIASPKTAESQTLPEFISCYDYPFAVYIDNKNSFTEKNPFIPKDTRFHYFLTDKENRPVFVGDPTSSEKLMKLFKTYIFKNQ